MMENEYVIVLRRDRALAIPLSVTSNKVPKKITRKSAQTSPKIGIFTPDRVSVQGIETLSTERLKY